MMMLLAMVLGSVVGAFAYYQVERRLKRALGQQLGRTIALIGFWSLMLLGMWGLTTVLDGNHSVLALSFFAGIIGPGVLIGRFLGPHFRAGIEGAKFSETRSEEDRL